MITEKKCKKCNETKQLHEFNKDKRTKDGTRSHCKICTRSFQREYNKRVYSKFHNKQKFLRKKYNIDEKKYNEMLLSQNNKCAICDNFSNTLLYIDHNHITGKVRGLLCNRCNIGIGYFKESIDLFYKAINYIKTND